MKVPMVVKIGLLTVGATGFYTYVGQLVPQKEVQPPQETQMAADMSTAELTEVGAELFAGKGLCTTCHTVGRSGALRFPDLAGIGGRASQQIPGMSDVQYLAQSLYEPNVFIVPGFSPGMPEIHKPPIGLTDPEIRAVIAYLQSLGGSATVTLQTPIGYGADGDAASGGEAASLAAGSGAEPGVAVAAAPGEVVGSAAAAGPRPPEALLEQYQCGSCHRLDAGSAGAPGVASLADVGARRSEPQIAGSLAAHPPFPSARAFESGVTVNELRALARHLSTRRGPA